MNRDEESMMDERFSIDADSSVLQEVRQRLEEFASSAGFDPESSGRIVMAVDEALTNIIRHAYKGKNGGKIDVELSAGPECLCILLRDYGVRVDTDNIQGRPLDEVKPGGLGVHIMNECMDSIEYLPAVGGGTRTVLRKALPDCKREEGEK